MRSVLFVLAATAAMGQSSRQFQLGQNQTKQEIEQIVTLLRATVDVRQVSADEVAKTVAVTGTPEQIAMADWLVHQLDRPQHTKSYGMHEYRPRGSGDDVLRVFYIANAASPRDVNEIATTVRSVADIRRLFIYSPLSAVTMRGTTEQISLAAWLMDQLDRPANESAAAPYEYPVAGDDQVRVFQLTSSQPPQQLQELVTLIRSIGDISRAFPYHMRRSVVVRATAERVMLAHWLVSALDRPAPSPAAVQDPAEPREYRLSSDPSNVVRIFSFPASQPVQEVQQTALNIRAATKIPRLFVYTPLRAMVVRSTAADMVTVERMIEQAKAQ